MGPGRRPAMTTLAPARARARTIASPSPVPPPVITTVFPSRLNRSSIELTFGTLSWCLSHATRPPAGSGNCGCSRLPQRDIPRGQEHPAPVVQAQDQVPLFVHLLRQPGQRPVGPRNFHLLP